MVRYGVRVENKRVVVQYMQVLGFAGSMTLPILCLSIPMAIINI
jgi:hypothetical protein